MWGLVKPRGQFRTVQGQGSVTADGGVNGELVIDVESVHTGIGKRDNHLRSADFFDAAQHPHITYTVTGVSNVEDDRATVEGTLEIAGQTRPLQLEARLRDVEADALTVTASLELDRSDWGITWKKMGMTKMSTPVEVVARFTRSS